MDDLALFVHLLGDDYLATLPRRIAKDDSEE
jgi:hypothetical protein